MAEEYNEYKDLSNAKLFTQQEEKSPIVSEVVSERDAFKKVFEREDGSFTAIISSGPVHYFEDGEWLEINNTLTETAGTISNESNGFTVDLPSEITSDKNVTIANENAELSFTMENISSSVAEITEVEPVDDETSTMMGLDNIASSVEYTSVMTNTDLVYDIGADSVKESIILSSCPSQATDYSYTINSNGATLYINEDNSINVVKNGQIEFVIESPYMFDTNGISTDDIDVSLENTNESTYTLTYSPDYDWLSSDERVYPVTIDPTTTVYSATAISEAFIGTDNSTATDLDKFHYLGADNKLYFKYSDSTSANFGKNSVITNAEFSLYCEALTDDDILGVYPITSTWNEPAEEETIEPVAESTDLLDYNVIVYGESAKRYVWDITEVAAKWQMNQTNNYGIVVKPYSDSSINTKIYRSSTANYTTRRPWFQIDYVTIDNIAEYDTESVDMGRAGTFYLNKYTGTYYVKRTDLSLNGNVSPVEMSFTYDPWSESVALGSSYGAYWITDYYNKIFYSQTITENDITRHQYTFRDNGGIKTRFVEVVSTDTDYNTVPEGFTESYLTNYTRYEAVSGDSSKCLWVPKSDTTYKDFANMIIEDSTYRYTIDSISRVTSRVHKTSGAVIAIDHRTASSDAIRSVTDGVGRKYDLPTAKDTNGKTITDKLVMYNSSGNMIKVSTLTGDVAIGVDYGYTAIDDSTSLLTTVTYADNESITYEYNTNGFMTAITNVDGSRLELRYSGDRVIGYTKYAYYVSADNSQNCFESQLDINFDGPKQRTFTYYEYDETTPSIVVKQRYDSTLRATDYINSDGEYSYTKTTTTETGEITSYSSNDSETINFIDNGDFSNGKTGWTFIPSNANHMIGNDMFVAPFDGIDSPWCIFYFGINTDLRASQTISRLPANEDNVYTLSAWAQGINASGTSYASNYSHIEKAFAICVLDSNDHILARYDYDTTAEGWQFGAVSFKTDIPLENVKVVFWADNQSVGIDFEDVKLVASPNGRVEVKENETFVTQSVESNTNEGAYCSCSDCSDNTCNCHECLSEECSCIGECAYQTCVGCSKSKDIETDSYGNLTCQSVSIGNKSFETVFEYTQDGNYVSSGSTSDGSTVNLNYNEDNGYLYSIKHGNNQTDYKYTAYGALSQVSQIVSGLSNGSFVSKEYTYTHDRLTSVTHNGFSYNFEYDGFGDKTSVKVENQALINYSYNKDRSLNTVEFSNGQKIHYTYDNGLITEIWLDDSTMCSYMYNYDDSGVLISIVDNINSTITICSEDNNLSIYEYFDGRTGDLIYSTVLSNNGITTHNVYGYVFEQYNLNTDYNHSNGHTTQITRFANHIGQSLDLIETSDYFDRNVNQKIEISDSYYFDYQYGFKDTALTAKKQVDSCVFSALVPNMSLLSVTWSWSYDEKGNLTRILEYNPEAQNEREIYSFIYDEAGQLIRCNDLCENVTYTYTYDIGGNLSTKKIFAYTTNELGEPLDIINYTYDSTWKDKLTSFDGKTIMCDSVGNPLYYDGWSFSWSAGRQLSHVSNADKSLAFKYNDRGLRTEKTLTANGKTTVIEYVWNENKLISQSDGTNKLYFIYDSKDRPIAFVLNGNQTFYYMKNPLGDILAIYDENGVYAGGYQYDSWGNCTADMSNEYPNIIYLNPFRYRGYIYDSETKLYYLQSRYYNPEWGRFINMDDVEYAENQKLLNFVGDNLFSYATNSPIMMIDSSGYNTLLNEVFADLINCIFILACIQEYTDCFKVGYDQNFETVIIDGKTVPVKPAGYKYVNKGAICVDFEHKQFYKMIQSLLITFDDSYVYQTLATYSLTLFEDSFNRPFLFTLDCVQNEIMEHYIGYLYGLGKNVELPAAMHLYYLYQSALVEMEYILSKYLLRQPAPKRNEQKIRNSFIAPCKQADVHEIDAIENTLEALCFNYFYSVESEYIGTNKDPYFNPQTGLREFTKGEEEYAQNWLTKVAL